MSKNTSVYLDLLRLVAAFCVFLDHSRAFVTPGLPAALASYGAEAVAVFFVLSGFVISYVVEAKEGDWRSYAVARIARVYPVAIIAIIATTVADFCGRYVNADQYALLNQQFHFYRAENLEALLRYLTFTNQNWFSHYVYGTDEPYWSLGFEVWYYILFGLIAFNPMHRGLVLTALAGAICGPKILMYFPLWLLGWLAFKLLSRAAMERNLAGWLWAASISTLILFVDKIFIRPTDVFHSWAAAQELRNLCYFYAIGVLVVVNIVSFDSFARGRRIWGAHLESGIRWAAGASFTLYLAHQPLEVLVSALFPSVGDHPALGALALAVILIVILLLAELAERRKSYFRALVEPLFNENVAERRAARVS